MANITGKRYSDAQKREVVSFVENHNKKNGRGGLTAASKKFKVSPITVTSWIKKAGGAGPSKAKRKTASRAPKKASVQSTGTQKARSSVLAKLAKLDAVITTKEADLANLQKEFEALKGSL